MSESQTISCQVSVHRWIASERMQRMSVAFSIAPHPILGKTAGWTPRKRWRRAALRTMCAFASSELSSSHYDHSKALAFCKCNGQCLMLQDLVELRKRFRALKIRLSEGGATKTVMVCDERGSSVSRCTHLGVYIRPASSLCFCAMWHFVCFYLAYLSRRCVVTTLSVIAFRRTVIMWTILCIQSFISIHTSSICIVICCFSAYLVRSTIHSRLASWCKMFADESALQITRSTP